MNSLCIYLIYYSHLIQFHDRTLVELTYYLRSYTGFDSSIQSAFETAAEMNDIIAKFLIAIIRMTETT